jgi:hypothetical protein
MKHPLALSIILAIPFFALSQDNQKQLRSIGITASLPWVNNYSYYNYNQGQSSSKSGFIGIGASLFYKTGKNKLSLNFGLTGDLPAPMGPFTYGKVGTRTNILATFREMLYHRKAVGKFSIIAGMNYVKYRFNFTSYEDSLPSYSIFDKTIGITSGCEYRFSKIFSLALLYRPTIISLDFKRYRHLISLDARFDIYLWKQK